MIRVELTDGRVFTYADDAVPGPAVADLRARGVATDDIVRVVHVIHREVWSQWRASKAPERVL